MSSDFSGSATPMMDSGRSSKRMKSSIDFLLNSSEPAVCEFQTVPPRSDSPLRESNSAPASSRPTTPIEMDALASLPRLSSVISMEQLRAQQQQHMRVIDALSQNNLPTRSGGKGPGYEPHGPTFNLAQPRPSIHRQSVPASAQLYGYAPQQQRQYPTQPQARPTSFQIPKSAYAATLAAVLSNSEAFRQATATARLSHNTFPNGKPIPALQQPNSYDRRRRPVYDDVDDDEDDDGYVNEEQDGDDEKQPKLKYSHKIAERKRRKDMNDTFDELRDCLPSKNIKMSKWEVLMAAADHITDLQKVRDKFALERETLHRELGLPVVELVSRQRK